MFASKPGVSRSNHGDAAPQIAQGQGGAALFEVLIPNDPSLPGLTLFVQCLVPDLGVNAANLTVSNAGEIVFGAK